MKPYFFSYITPTDNNTKRVYKKDVLILRFKQAKLILNPGRKLNLTIFPITFTFQTGVLFTDKLKLTAKPQTAWNLKRSSYSSTVAVSGN